MAATVVVLTEDALLPVDAEQIVEHARALGLEPRFEVLVPADTDHEVVPELLDALTLLDLREAWDAASERRHDPDRARAEAGDALERSLAQLREAGGEAAGAVVQDDPLPALRQAVAATDAAEVVVVTLPHPWEDAFRRDWASRAREELGVPVLHLYTGTSRVG